MKEPHKRFTTSYYDEDLHDYSKDYGKQPDGFDKVEEAVTWNESKGIPLYLVSMTEWDIDNDFNDYYNIPEILQQGNLESWKHNDLIPTG